MYYNMFYHTTPNLKFFNCKSNFYFNPNLPVIDYYFFLFLIFISWTINFMVYKPHFNLATDHICI